MKSLKIKLIVFIKMEEYLFFEHMKQKQNEYENGNVKISQLSRCCAHFTFL
ncbi:hypothetical protein ACIQZI_08125 [Peribacillus sp. NPDC096379]|uniref:hypothetical protein n=1 Tax=Peribacillus sp. NPDC096379 TaxID=3364393 RepID=UPI003824193A